MEAPFCIVTLYYEHGITMLLTYFRGSGNDVNLCRKSAQCIDVTTVCVLSIDIRFPEDLGNGRTVSYSPVFGVCVNKNCVY